MFFFFSYDELCFRLIGRFVLLWFSPVVDGEKMSGPTSSDLGFPRLVDGDL